MALDDRTRGRRAGERSMQDPVAGVVGLFGDREDRFVVLAGAAITAAVLYDVYRRQTRAGPVERRQD